MSEIIKSLTGQELLLLRILHGQDLKATIGAELNRRARLSLWYPNVPVVEATQHPASTGNLSQAA